MVHQNSVGTLWGPSAIKIPLASKIKRLHALSSARRVRSTKIRLMVTLALVLVAYLRAFLVPSHRLALEAASLRQQFAVFKRKQSHPKLERLDPLFWIVLRRLWPRWTEVLIIVKPETMVSWHRAGFRLFWRWRSRIRRPGRPKVSEEIRHLIRRMKAENPTWGAPRIHGELLQLGFHISEPTVSRYLQRLRRRGWLEERSALRKNSTGPSFHAAFSKATNSIFVAARRWAFNSR